MLHRKLLLVGLILYFFGFSVVAQTAPGGLEAKKETATKDNSAAVQALSKSALRAYAYWQANRAANDSLTKAVQLIKALADKEFPGAMYYLGNFYENGI